MKLLKLLIMPLLMITACASIPDPRGSMNALVIGETTFVGKNFSNAGGASLEGSHDYDVEITIQELSSGKKIILSRAYRFVFSTDVTPGEYAISKVLVKVTGGDESSMSLWTVPNNRFFTIAPGVVNNIGKINIEAEKDEKIHLTIIDYDIVLNDLKKQFPRSKWTGVKWNKTDLSPVPRKKRKDDSVI